MRKVIIALAPVEAGQPIDKEALVEDVVQSARAGAAVCHLHCRRPDGSLTADIRELSDTFLQIGARTDLILQASTGGVSDMTIEERCRPLNCPGVESASLNGGTTNLGEAVYVNSPADIRYCAGRIMEKGILPEVEVFDIGMIYSMERIRKELSYAEPFLYNLVFGHAGGMQPDIGCLTAFRNAVPAGSLWGVTHYGRDNWEFLAAAIAMGASEVRIGFEDSRYLGAGIGAKQNWEEVARLSALLRAMDIGSATPAEARQMLGIQPVSGRQGQKGCVQEDRPCMESH